MNIPDQKYTRPNYDDGYDSETELSDDDLSFPDDLSDDDLYDDDDDFELEDDN
jgi:hypothetical protein